MKSTTRALAASAVVTVLAAGCGSSSHSPSHALGSKAGAATPASSGGYGGYGGYGATSSTTSSATPTALITTKHSARYGTILAFGSKQLTVYLFTKDSGRTSNCTGQCAKFWPPVTGRPSAQAGAASADLATITRAGGAKQVTYKGHPLYLFSGDHGAGDISGQGMTAFGGTWYAVKPSGTPARPA
ncbi:MAG TPA: hypothetical protein VE983_10795 [Solirubrobacteraceae bacterium]|nr:hypothetical protein [Solirubrobacteraceae bacterium]